MNGENLNALNTPRHILVVGDSCAAWMVMAFFKKVYRAPAKGRFEPPNPVVRLSLVTHNEDEVFAAPVSVLPEFMEFVNFLEISERELLPQTNGAFKLANVYRGWAADRHAHIHAFGDYGAPMAFVDFPQVYQRLCKIKHTAEDLHEFSLAALAARLDRFQHPSDDPTSIYAGLAYGLRFDERLFRQWLVDWVGADVECIKARVTDVRVGGAHTIDAIKAGDTDLSPDFVIDCSQARVLDSAMAKAKSTAITRCNTAIGSDLRVRAIAGQNPGNLGCDLLTAKSAGLECLQPDRQKLCLNLFAASDQMDEKTLVRFKQTFAHSPWEIKHHDNFYCSQAWRGNCVSLGPAAVNINTPIVSNLDLCWAGLAPLVKYAPLKTTCSAMADAYNEVVRVRYERVKDYVVLLRELAVARSEKFWRLNREAEYSQNMINKLLMYDHMGVFPEVEQEPFSTRDQLVLLMGLRRYPMNDNPLSAGLDRDEVTAHAEKIRLAIARALQDMPEQKHYLIRHYSHQ